MLDAKRLSPQSRRTLSILVPSSVSVTLASTHSLGMRLLCSKPPIMPGVEASGTVDSSDSSSSSSLSDHLLSLSLNGVHKQTESVSEDQFVKKDPREIAREYQLELCKKALKENIIVYLGTGCGKTHIAVLLMYEMGHLIRKPQKNVCVFLAPTVALVNQQADVIEESTDFKVGVYRGSSKRLKKHQDWMQEIEQHEVLVMTPQILLRGLSHTFIKMEMISLLIFDECHHAQVKSNHPYAEIMKVFYERESSKIPRIFGMTASPVVGKGASSKGNLSRSINSLERLLDSKVYSVSQKEVDTFVAPPVVTIYYYGRSANEPLYTNYCTKLWEIKCQCIEILRSSTEYHLKRRNTKKLLNRMHNNVLFCLENLGVCGVLQASRVLLSGDHSERLEFVEEEGSASEYSFCDKYLARVSEFFISECMKGDHLSDLSSLDNLKEPLFSRKLLRLIGILSSFRPQPDMKCIIFVNRIVTARSLSYILQQLKILARWKSDFLVGVHAGIKSSSRKTMSIILDKFRSGELNLLVATKVGEEGLDIQTCCLVIRFDLPETVASFIQSRGRARMAKSEYAFLVDSGNKKDMDLIECFKEDENRMNKEVAFRTSYDTHIIPEERIYKVISTGASVTSAYSVSLLHNYCSKLPHDEYFDPKPEFFYFDDLGGTVCHVTLPSNAPIHQIVSAPHGSMEAAKKAACLQAVEELHKLGALSDCLLPRQDEANPEEVSDSSDSDENEDDNSRGELYEMLVPSAFRQAWSHSDDIVHLNSYLLKFRPSPEDRIYKEFGLFMMTRLPAEAVKLEIDLHLARGRTVMTRFVPFGAIEFDKAEIQMAQHFQEMSLKIILDRSEFVHEFVPLGSSDVLQTSTSTFYLVLPVIMQDCERTMSVDWKTVKRCLSSPIFRPPGQPVTPKLFPWRGNLQLADGWKSVSDIENSLVYAPHKKLFYFITEIVYEKDALSPYKDLGSSSYADHFIKRFSIHLKYPKQPLLCAKPLFNLHNLLHNRKQEDTETQELEEYFIYLPPELCELKIIGFSKDIGSSLSLVPSIMHRLGNLLVAIELKHLLRSSFSEADEVSAERVLEALTTEKCQERLSLERLEVLGDAFLKFAVARHFFLMNDSLHEGDLTRRRSNVVNNSNLFKLATKRNLQVYIRDQAFDPSQFFALGHPCLRVCTPETEESIHSCLNSPEEQGRSSEVRCNKNHHWLYRKTVADVIEALIGAFIIDSGFKAATAFLTYLGIQVKFESLQVVNACKASMGYIPLSMHIDIPSLEDELKYHFVHKGLLLQAFVHPSYNKHGGGCYQRLEFLGDAVLDYLITSYLYSAYPQLKPGQLTDLRSVSVNNKAFAYVAVGKGFHNFLLCDSHGLSDAIEKYVDYIKGSKAHSGVHGGPKCPKALGDLVESCVGAILVDSGFNLNSVWKIMTSFLENIMKFSSGLQLSPIRDLQELCQSHSLDLQFLKSKTSRMFSVEAKVTGKDVSETASATSMNQKEASRIASQLVFSELKSKGWKPKSKSLEEVLKSTFKAEGKLLGYDETPIDITEAGIEPVMVEGDQCSSFDPEIFRICDDEVVDGYPPHSTSVRQQVPSSSVTGKLGEEIEDHERDCDSQRARMLECVVKGTSRSRLYEFCAANCWKPPSFECCKVEGPDHLKLFTCKVTLEIEDASNMILECVGTPQSRKKEAAEAAAEGAFWYLEKEGHLL
ncbi:dicer-like protein 4 isoform X2 [Prosopis cineraria]|uniref:dicer-like protein 4 isoform X2 n=1 Tax=Prosopis cineraria TaxID=364024 RepID=UPI00240EFD33|nr:dicer-like protein 4 isoform X2 [Prosopis cineraria]